MTGVTCAEIGQKISCKSSLRGDFPRHDNGPKKANAERILFPTKGHFASVSPYAPSHNHFHSRHSLFMVFPFIYNPLCARWWIRWWQKGPRECTRRETSEDSPSLKTIEWMKHIRQDFSGFFVCGNMNNTSSRAPLNGNMLDLFRVCAGERGKTFCFNLISCLKDTSCYQSLLWDKCGKMFHHNLGFVFRKRAWSICVFFNPVSSLFIRHGSAFVSDVVTRGDENAFRSLA